LQVKKKDVSLHPLRKPGVFLGIKTVGIRGGSLIRNQLKKIFFIFDKKVANYQKGCIFAPA